MRRKVVINWGVSSYYGWGVYGLNLALRWAADPEVGLVCARAVNPAELGVDPVAFRALGGFIADSAGLDRQLAPLSGVDATVGNVVLAGLYPDFRLAPVRDGLVLKGSPTIGVTFFESAHLPPGAAANAAALPLVVTGSTWNEQVLRAHGVTNVRTVLQGVDPGLFFPGPRARDLGDRFLVFTGGKLEDRKGQDIALAAFRKFAERRRDALLVAAWHSPWPEMARSVERAGLVAPVVFQADGGLDATAWAAANGVPLHNFLDAGRTPNSLMPQLLRRMDVALFTNRCEGGTNLVAMECMACGVPTILSANSGHLDLIGEDNCYPLTRQAPIADLPRAAPFGDVPGWGESDVDEAVELLERAYLDREEARRRGARGAASLSRLTWAATADALKQIVLEHAPPVSA